MISTLKKALLLTFTLVRINSFAQTARELTNEGIQLSNAKNYAAAIDKYKAALAIDTANTTAKYQLAFALNATGKGPMLCPILRMC